jgi:hypothetical protein
MLIFLAMETGSLLVSRASALEERGGSTILIGAGS